MWWIVIVELSGHADPGEPPELSVSLVRQENTLLLVSYEAPWKEVPSNGSVAFSRDINWSAGIKLLLEKDGLLGVRRRAQGISGNRVQDTTVGGRPALEVHYEAFHERDTWTGYYFVNDRGDTVEISVMDSLPEAEVAAFLASVQHLGAPVVPKDAQFEVSGTVGVQTGDCMPPTPCTPAPMATKIVFRSIGPDGRVGRIVKTTQSDAQGRYSLELPPGSYSVLPVDRGQEVCKSIGPLGPCGLRVLDGPVRYDPLIDNALH
jgi:hypothetical protein